ncbi:hypothetical protein WN944_007824 [Citrus x changshan-huyou]|uniref:Uncharacterized protein n=1 Tax=Citrus x changshan-huyou TaxID=2935761 RepID=A0AAP0QQS0_9ROSI
MRTSLVPGCLEGLRNVPNVRPDGSATGLMLKAQGSTQRELSYWALASNFNKQSKQQFTSGAEDTQNCGRLSLTAPRLFPSRPLLPIKMIRLWPCLLSGVYRATAGNRTRTRR